MFSFCLGLFFFFFFFFPFHLLLLSFSLCFFFSFQMDTSASDLICAFEIPPWWYSLLRTSTSVKTSKSRVARGRIEVKTSNFSLFMIYLLVGAASSSLQKLTLFIYFISVPVTFSHSTQVSINSYFHPVRYQLVSFFALEAHIRLFLHDFCWTSYTN